MTTTRTISNSDDVIDSRDVIARIEELKAAWTEATEGDNPDDYALSEDDWKAGLDDDEAAEIVALLALADEACASPDWQYGETLIRDSYFEDYARKLAEDIGAVPRDASWPAYCIDCERAARELQMDYYSRALAMLGRVNPVEFDGVTYWVRS